MWELQVRGSTLHIATARLSAEGTITFQLNSMASPSRIQRNDYSDRGEETLGRKANPDKANYGVKSPKLLQKLKRWNIWGISPQVIGLYFCWVRWYCVTPAVSELNLYMPFCNQWLLLQMSYWLVRSSLSENCAFLFCANNHQTRSPPPRTRQANTLCNSYIEEVESITFGNF